MRFSGDYRGLGELLKSTGLQDACVKGAEVGANHVRTTGPRDDDEYVSEIDVERGMSLKGDRVAASVVANAPHSAALEFGNRRTKAQHPLQSMISVIEGR